VFEVNWKKLGIFEKSVNRPAHVNSVAQLICTGSSPLGDEPNRPNRQRCESGARRTTAHHRARLRPHRPHVLPCAPTVPPLSSALASMRCKALSLTILFCRHRSLALVPLSTAIEEPVLRHCRCCCSRAHLLLPEWNSTIQATGHCEAEAAKPSHLLLHPMSPSTWMSHSDHPPAPSPALRAPPCPRAPRRPLQLRPRPPRAECTA
jgi:hypothetical protein